MMLMSMTSCLLPISGNNEVMTSTSEEGFFFHVESPGRHVTKGDSVEYCLHENGSIQYIRVWNGGEYQGTVHNPITYIQVREVTGKQPFPIY